jgi:mRNA-degrading endonuclease YafQ of YafQ-DinJ toxin-antitoxin module
MLIISITPSFQRQFKKLEESLKEDVRQKVFLLQEESNHKSLKVHKLKGRLKDRCSFSVNYKIRIVFNYLTPKEIILLAVGGHDVYQD